MRLIPLLLVVILFSCGQKNNAPDVSDIKTDVEIHRFDKDFFSIDTTQLERSIALLERKYPSFLPLYFEYFSPIDFIVRQQNKTFGEAVTEYYRDMKPLFDSAYARFRDLSKKERELEKHFRYVKYYFPEIRTPAVLTTVESLNPENPLEIYGTTYYHDTLIISLQMFLGKHATAYDPSYYPDYIRRRFEPEFMVVNSFRAMANDIYSGDAESSSLIEQMIEKGKQWYLLSKFLPDTPDSLITGYTAKQMEWCKKNEGNIWGYINQNENLFSTDNATIQTYIGEAPFTSTLPHGNAGEGAPGNIGAWIGWRIIESYQSQTNAALKDLLKTPPRRLFQEAKYKPK